MPGSYFRAKNPNRYRRAGRAINAINTVKKRVMRYVKKNAYHKSQIVPMRDAIVKRFPTRNKVKAMTAVFRKFGNKLMPKRSQIVNNLLKWGPMPR